MKTCSPKLQLLWLVLAAFLPLGCGGREQNHFDSQSGEREPAELAGPAAGQSWTNSLGMKFVPVPGTPVRFCVWETRVRDFEAFVNATGYDATRGMCSLHRDGLKFGVDNWKSPGFTQEATHPVVGVSWEDAKAFCEWLTRIERQQGRLTDQQSYRLPRDAEWSAAVGSGKYPWGEQWPPTAGAGNYAGEEVKTEDTPSGFIVIRGYNDGHPRTSPVGSFKANPFGLYDLGGNAGEWCEDWYRKEMNTEDLRKRLPDLENDGDGHKFRVLRGASWILFGQRGLLSSRRGLSTPDYRYCGVGFRCVLVGQSSP